MIGAIMKERNLNVFVFYVELTISKILDAKSYPQPITFFKSITVANNINFNTKPSDALCFELLI